ncbi:MAG: GNAT family N-acetyltransferase [Propionibacteriaceae bacterium]|jgi:ribosomal protein S18 acetylase RimI-like enzyme|nr:GNAT family N-acetyltransferase [Propionibacteriaceae bacterium]
MRPRLLGPEDAPDVRRIVSADPVRNIYVAARVELGALDSHAPGQLWGWPGGDVASLLYVGQNMVPVAVDATAISAFAGFMGRRRTCTSILGPAEQSLPLWGALSRRYGRSYSAVREIRPRQPMLALSTPPEWKADTRVRPITMAEFNLYLDASVAMYAEEVGAEPGADLHARFRSHYYRLVSSGRAFGIVEGGRVVFKADVGTAVGPVAQIQGVWMAPEYRGHGLSTAAMAAVVEYVLAEHRTACLYVNEFNAPALRCYEKLGFTRVGELATILY